MSTIRLLYPDHRSGGLSTYYLGALLMERILPENPAQPTYRVPVAAPDGTEAVITGGIAARDEVFSGIHAAKAILQAAAPSRVITIGGNCVVSLASFDYLHAQYPEAGILWIDAHPDVSLPENGYPNAHAMVLGALLGQGEATMTAELTAPAFAAKDVLYVGLQGLHDYQAAFLQKVGVPYRVQTDGILSDEDITAFCAAHPQVLVHFDIDVLNPQTFHDTYFANPTLVGDGSSGGIMTMAQLAHVMQLIAKTSDMVGLTVAEYLPFDAERLQNAIKDLPIFAS